MDLIHFLLLFAILKEGTSQCSHTNPCVFDGLGGAALVQPSQEVSNGGSLSLTLNVQMADVTIEWLTLFRRTFNGGFPGPTWRIKRGDTVQVTLNNQLSLPHKEEAINQQRLPNSTNIHTHGLHISSQEPQDNVFVHLAPGESYTYTYQIDAEQPGGTYWYHPHLHGSTFFQVHSGMAGMIIVEDPTSGTAAAPAHLAAVSCPDNCQHDIQLIFQPTLSYINNAGRGFANIQNQIEDNESFRHSQFSVTAQTTLEDWLTDAANGVDHFTTNGQIFPRLDLTAGEIKRFRMVNAGGSATLELIVVDSQTNNAACTYMEIAFDGIYLDAPRTPSSSKTFLPPSSKADWLIVCNTPGTYQLRSTPSAADAASMGGFERHDGLLLTIQVTGTAATTALGTTLPTRESFVNDFRALTQDQVAGRFVVEAGPRTQLNRATFTSNTDYRFKSELGTVQEWYLTNTDSNLGHPIHIHVNHFQVISYNPYTGPIAANQGAYASTLGVRCDFPASTAAQVMIPPNAQQYITNGHDLRYARGGDGTLGYAPVGDFRDVIVVPPLANITIRFMAHKFLGEVVMHCHILSHEDSGMMMTTDIVSPGSDLTANSFTTSGYPGQCFACDPIPFNHAVSTCTAVVAVSGGGSSARCSSAAFVWTLIALVLVWKNIV